MAKALRIATVGDIHLGHRRTPTEYIIRNLNVHLVNERILKTLDMLVIVGDMFDAALSMSGSDFPLIHRFAHRLVSLCNKHRVVLRILEGTPYHDRKQSVIFEEAASMQAEHQTSVWSDVKWIREHSVETLESIHLSVLYVPDECGPSAAKILERSDQLMLDHWGIRHCDLAFVHGSFDFQCPAAGINQHTHLTGEYAQRVDGFLAAGHEHIRKESSKLCGSGSFDRLGHGTEDSKGYFIHTYDMARGGWIREFIENTDAMSYVTVDVTNRDIDTARLMIHRAAAKVITKPGHLRILCDKGSIIALCLREFEALYIGMQITIETRSTEQETSGVAALSPKDITASILTIRSDNLVDLCASVAKEQGLSEADVSTIAATLKEYAI